MSRDLLMLCAAVLSVLLRENENMRFVNVRDKEFLFADGRVLSQDESEKYFREIAKILNVLQGCEV